MPVQMPPAERKRNCHPLPVPAGSRSLAQPLSGARECRMFVKAEVSQFACADRLGPAGNLRELAEWVLDIIEHRYTMAAMGRRSHAKIGLAAVAALVAAGVVGFVIGHSDRGTAFVTGPGIVYAGPNGGTAYLGADQPLDHQPRGFAYFFPPDLAWTDASGSIHEGQRPTCVPIDHAVRIKQMDAIQDPVRGVGTVLWVRC